MGFSPQVPRGRPDRGLLAVGLRAELVPRAHAITLPPHIDLFSVKNQWMSELSTRAILSTAGLVESAPGVCCSVYVGEDGTPREVVRRADVIRMGGPPKWSAPLVVQVSRWIA